MSSVTSRCETVCASTHGSIGSHDNSVTPKWGPRICLNAVGANVVGAALVWPSHV